MNILKYICLPGLLVSGDIQTVSAVESKTDKNPNILVILIDDAGYNDFGFMGSKEMQTPNIDALTSEGVVFTDAHVAATVSSPSRACLITGRYGHRFGYECNLSDRTNGLPLEEETIAEVFKTNGYRTAAIGKWHLGSRDEQHPNNRGFDLFYGMKAGGRDYFYNEKKSDRPGDERNLLLNDRQVKFEKYLTDAFSEKAVEFINESSQPFMMYLAYNAVHTPMQATDEDMAKFEGHPRQKLAAMTYALDRGVGTVIRGLKDSGKFDNTLIFFLSDNGGATTNQSSNYPLKGFKGNKFEGGHIFHPPATVSPAPASKRLQRGQYRSVDSFPPDVSLHGFWLHWLSCHRYFPATRRLLRGSSPSPAGSVKIRKAVPLFSRRLPRGS